MAPTLHDEMARATDAAHIDTEALVSSARRRGLAIRRRRQALSTIGGLGVAGAAAALVLAVVPGTGDDAPRAADRSAASSGTGAAPSSTAGGFAATPTSPFTGRSTAAALLYAVQQQSPGGRATDVRWQGPGDVGGETYAVFRFTPTDSGTPGEVGINVQPGMATEVGDTCTPSFMHDCTVRALPDGSTLRTYDDLSGKDRAGIRRVAELLRPDGVRVIASASNGLDVTENDEQVTRGDPVLDLDQLRAIVTQPWWGPELPAYFTRTGAGLTGVGLSSDASSPTPVS
jgi:hypothetical protein